MPVLIKNCGLRTPEDMSQAATTGARYIGFVHYPKSPRHLTLEEGQALRPHVPEGVRLAAVLVNPDDTTLAEIVNAWQPDLLQLHGITDPTQLEAIRKTYGLPLILGWPVATAADIRKTDAYRGIADYLLLDTAKAGEHGGTGEAFDWTLLRQEKPALPFFLAGGLTPENVAEAVRITGANGVDVSSGIESKPGIKSPEKIAAFNRAVLHGADD